MNKNNNYEIFLIFSRSFSAASLSGADQKAASGRGNRVLQFPQIESGDFFGTELPQCSG